MNVPTLLFVAGLVTLIIGITARDRRHRPSRLADLAGYRVQPPSPFLYRTDEEQTFVRRNLLAFPHKHVGQLPESTRAWASKLAITKLQEYEDEARLYTRGWRAR